MTDNPKTMTAAKRWRLKNKERIALYNRRWKDAHPEASKKYNKRRRSKRKLYDKKYKELNGEKIKARTLVLWNIRCGKLKQKPCVKCGNAKSQAHHPDYSKPLKVKWLCQRHHAILHQAA